MPEDARTPATDPARPHRGTIFVEDAELLDIEAWPGEQFIMRLVAPKCAARARPGSFVHLNCDSALPMRRPLSLMRADPGSGVIEILFKIVGEGLRLLSRRRPGDRISVLGPIGQPFVPHTALALGDDLFTEIHPHHVGHVAEPQQKAHPGAAASG